MRVNRRTRLFLIIGVAVIIIAVLGIIFGPRVLSAVFNNKVGTVSTGPTPVTDPRKITTATPIPTDSPSAVPTKSATPSNEYLPVGKKLSGNDQAQASTIASNTYSSLCSYDGKSNSSDREKMFAPLFVSNVNFSALLPAQAQTCNLSGASVIGLTKAGLPVVYFVSHEFTKGAAKNSFKTYALYETMEKSGNTWKVADVKRDFQKRF